MSIAKLCRHLLVGCGLFYASASWAQGAAEPATAAPADAPADAVDAVPPEPTPPPPATEVKAEDQPNDSGDAVVVTWKDSVDTTVLQYEVLWADRADAQDAPALAEGEKQRYGRTAQHQDASVHWQTLGTVIKGDQRRVFSGAKRGTPYYFKVVAIAPSGARVDSAMVGPVEATAQWFNADKTWLCVLGVFVCFFIIFFIQWARSGKNLFIRKIAGLEAVDEAIGRATEMGRPVVFVPGIMDLDNVQTLAGLTMLGHVSKSIAEYGTKLDVPVSRSLVMTAGREVVKQSYLEAGRPDAYSDDMVHYLTDEQFGYVAGVNGILVRDEPATCVYMGAFYAESLILAETGNGIGAIQIAGTAMPAQLPFFVAACDYTLIGEELFAASAYLSGDPKQLGSLKGQDIGKTLVMVAIGLGSLAATLASVTGSAAMQSVHKFIFGIFS